VELFPRKLVVFHLHLVESPRLELPQAPSERTPKPIPKKNPPY
jgi:hypothetical protein